MNIEKLQSYGDGSYVKRLYVTGNFQIPVYGRGINQPPTGTRLEPRVYNPSEIQPGAKIVTVPYTQSGWVWSKPYVNNNGERIREATNDKNRRLTVINYGDTHKVYLHDKSGNLIEIDPDRVYNNLKVTYPKEMSFKDGGTLENNNGMTYDYDEFMSLFAGVEEYKCGGKTKKKACGGNMKPKKEACGGKTKKMEDGGKPKKDSSDANDNAAVKPGEKADPWMLPQNKSQDSSSFLSKITNTTKKASIVANNAVATKKLIKKLK